MIIIPCGIDCGLAELLKKTNLRQFSLPFDWSVSYGGISKIIKNEFKDFIPINSIKINTIYDYSFVHNNFPQDTEIMTRRCNRLLDLLGSASDELIFIRKGHAFHHHTETSKLCLKLENDITDAEDLSIVLKEKYPTLRYKIIVALVCDTCFDKTTDYATNDVNVEIHNIATPTFDDDKFENLLNDIISTL
jgi:hypothetical protein